MVTKKDFDEITVKVRDYEDQLVKMIDHIMRAANPGHSFEVIVDPDLRERTTKFYFDGDGAFYIKEVKKNGKKVNIKDEKILETYLGDIQC